MYFPAGINQGLAAALRAPPSGLFIALVIQVPAGTALGGGSVGGAVPSTLREEKVATFCLAVVVTLRLPEAGGGEGWIIE